MNNDVILDKLLAVFRDVFEDDELAISAATKSGDVEGWDSLRHVSLMLNVEQAFGVKFTSSQIASLKNVGELIELVASRLASKSGEGRAR